MNLLNGLAVSDTAVIRDKAEIVTYIIRQGNILQKGGKVLVTF